MRRSERDGVAKFLRIARMPWIFKVDREIDKKKMFWNSFFVINLNKAADEFEAGIGEIEIFRDSHVNDLELTPIVGEISGFNGRDYDVLMRRAPLRAFRSFRVIKS